MSNELGLDRSGNNNNWTVNNMTLAADQMLDSPTNNFCTLNALHHDSDHNAVPNATYYEGNLKISTTAQAGGASSNFFGTMGVTSGKWYWEAIRTGGNVAGAVGFSDYNGVDQRVYYGGNGYAYTYSSSASYGASWTTGDIIGIAFDADTQALTFYKNGSTQGTISSAVGSGKTYFPMGWDGSGSLYSIFITNFGQDSSFAGTETAQGNQDSNGIGDFYYTPPTGFLALCTSNLPAVAVTPSEHFNTVLYTGDGNTTQDITGVGFQPDFLWVKRRSSPSYSHNNHDVVRGITNRLRADNTDAEAADGASSGYVRAVLSDGFTIGNNSHTNENAKSYVAWNWKANGSGSSNTDGSITSTVSANVDAGFSIVSYTGTGSAGTIGHGLSSAPEMIIVKSRSFADNWEVYHEGLNADAHDYLIRLNSSAASATVGDFWNTSSYPTNSLFGISVYDQLAKNNETFIAYCFHSVDGYSKVGSYTGNGNADGTFIYTGFKPAFLMVKATHTTTSWIIVDNKRNTSNPMKSAVYPNNSNAEEDWTSPPFDFTSNGFKTRYAHGLINGSGGHYIYIAFAETPFKYSNAR